MEPGITSSLKRTFSQPVNYYGLYGVAVLLVLVLCWLIIISGTQVRKLEAVDHGTRRCDLATGGPGPTLYILDAVYAESAEVLEVLCRSPELGRHFSSVELSSQHRDAIDLRTLFETRYDLVLAKPELMSRVGREGTGYELLARYPSYGSQLVSMQGKPELTREYMQGKRLGLLDDPNSVSAYQIPKAALRASGLDGVPTIVYFRSYRQLYGALFEGEVDVIPGLLSEEGPQSSLQLPPGLVLEAALPGPAWYIRRDYLGASLHCDLLAALEQLGPRAEIDYLRRLDVLRRCDEK